MSRLAPIKPESFTDAQKDLFEAIVGGARAAIRARDRFEAEDGGLRGPFNAFLTAPAVGGPAQALGAAVRFETSLPAPLRELAVLMVARDWRAQYEWWAHARIAREVGLPEDVVAAIKDGRRPAGDAAVTTVYDYCRALLDTRAVDDALHSDAASMLGDAGVVELVVLLGYYTLVSMTLNAFAVPVPAGETPPFED